jgi:hypothetical protein
VLGLQATKVYMQQLNFAMIQKRMRASVIGSTEAFPEFVAQSGYKGDKCLIT